MNSSVWRGRRDVLLTGMKGGLGFLAVCIPLACATVEPTTYASRPNSGLSVNALGAQFVMRAESTDTRGLYDVTVGTWEPGASFGSHHHDFDEFYYVLEGQITLTDDTGTSVGGPGSVYFFPRGNVHTFTNEGDTPLKMLLMWSPAFGKGIRQVLTGLRSLSPDDPDYFAQVGALFHEHETVFVE